MRKRAMATLVLPLGLAACGDAPLGPRDAASAEVSAAKATLVISDGRAAELTAAVEDARTRLLAGVGEGDALHSALAQLSAALASADRAALDRAVAQARTALDGLAAQQDAAVAAELDAIRLALDEVVVSTASSEGTELQH